MKIEHMNEFIVLAKTLNYTKASEKLFITQPVLSRHISSLEIELGVKLFERSTHGVRLTPDGQSVLTVFTKILAQYTHLQEQLDASIEGLIGEIHLGVLYYSFDYFIAPIIKSFQAAYPNIEIKISSYQSDTLVDDLISDTVDAGITYGYTVQEASSLVFEPLFKERLIAIHTSSHPFAQKESIAIADLRGQTLVLIRGGVAEPHSLQVLQEIKDRNQGIPEIYEIYNVDMLFMAIRESNGVAVVPYHMSSVLREDIAYSEIDDFLSDDLGIVYKSDNNNPVIPLLIKSSRALFSESTWKSQQV